MSKKAVLILLLSATLLTFVAKAQIANTVSYPIATFTNITLENMTLAATAFTSGAAGIASFDFGPVALGFKFCLGGYCYDSLLIGVDGYVKLISRNVSYQPQPIEAAAYRAFVAALYNPSNTGTDGYVKYLASGTAPNRKFIVHYKLALMGWFPASNTAPYEFQLVLHENGSMSFNYAITPASWAGVNTYNQRAYFTGFTYNLYAPQTASLVTVDTQTAISTSTVNYTSTVAIYNREALPTLSQISFTPVYSRVSKPPVSIAGAFSKCLSLNITDTTMNENYIDIYRSSNGVLFDKFISRIITNMSGTGQSYILTDTLAITPLTSYTYAVLSRNLMSVPDTVFITATTSGPSLSGVKSIPGDYGTLTEALQNIRCQQLNGDIYLELGSGYNPQSEIFPLEFDSRINASANRRVIIRPAAAANATILNTSDNPMLSLRNFSFLEIDGRPGGQGNSCALGLVNDTTSSPLIRLGKLSDSCSFRYCNLQGRGRWDNALQSLVIMDSGKVSHNIFDNCVFAPSKSQYWLENVIYSNGNPINPNNANSITNCSFINFGSMVNRTKNHITEINGIDLQQGNNDVTITGNSFFFTDTLASYVKTQVISISTSSGSGFRVDSNYFGGTLAGCGGQKSQIKVYGGAFKYIVYQSNSTQTVSISGNIFRNIHLEGVNIFGSCCGMFNFIESVTNKSIIHNNYFGDSTNISSVEYGYPISNYVPIELYLISCGTPWGPYDLSIRNNIFAGLQFRGQFDLFCTNIGLSAPGGNKVDFKHNQIGGPQDSSIVNYSTFFGIRGSTLGNDMIVIDSNTIKNVAAVEAHTIFYDRSVPYQTLSANIGLIVRGNLISRIRVNSSQESDGIQIICNGKALVIDNEIHTISTTGIGRVCGITTNYGGSAPGHYLIRRNFIHNLYNLNPGGEVRAIQTSMNCNVENNMVSIGLDENGQSVAGYMCGIFLYSETGDTTYYRHNSIHVGGGFQNTQYNMGLCLEIQQNTQGVYSNVVVENNIFSANRFGYDALYNAILKMPYGGGINTLFKCDYNQYYADTTNYFMDFGVTLSAWQNSSGLDYNSFMNKALFLNAEGNALTTDLHLQNFNFAEGAGKPSSITYDFDNDFRPSLTPIDIGADAGNYTLITKVNLGTDREICDSLILDAGDHMSYLWSTGAITRSIVITSPGQYIVNVINWANQGDSDAITIYAGISPTMGVVTSSNSTCAGGAIGFSLTGAQNYSLNAVSCTSDFTYSPVASGTYSIIGQGVNGCTTAAVIALTVYSNPVLTVTASESVICSGVSVTLTAQGADTYSWSGLEEQGNVIVVSPTITTAYFVTGFNVNGCESVTAITQNVDECTGLKHLLESRGDFFVFPNPFTHTFYIELGENAQYNELEIFSSSGQLLLTQKINSPHTEINLQQYAHDIYNIRLKGKEQASFKIIKD